MYSVMYYSAIICNHTDKDHEAGLILSNPVGARILMHEAGALAPSFLKSTFTSLFFHHATSHPLIGRHGVEYASPR